MSAQLELVKQIHGNSTVPYGVIDNNYNVIWSNITAQKLYPALLVPSGISILFSSGEIDQIREKAETDFSICLAAIPNFAANFTKIDEGYLFSIGFADGSQLSALPESISQMTNAISAGIRAPLANIFSAVGAISQYEAENPKIGDSLSTINQSGYHMLKFAINFSSYLRGITGGEGFYPERVDLCQMLDSIVQAVSILTSSVGIKTTLNLPEEPIIIMADENMFMQAVLEIISNSCRFSQEKNEILISLSREDNRAILTFEDKGVGMPQEVIKKACQPFYSFDIQGLPMAGTGLGLSVAQSIVMQHQGSLAIFSEEGKKTIVAVGLPIVEDDVLTLKSPPIAADLLRDRFSLLHVILSDSCGVPKP